MLLQQDTLFDERYLLIKLLGCGGFSEVWLVEDIKVGNKKMALKIYAPDKGLDNDGVQLFSSEFELVFDLNHTHLLRPAHFDVYERSPYLLMPYCEQGSANKLVGRFDEEDAWHFLHDVAAGLAYLHEQNPPIIHQDIKPDNILKDHLGHYQITDFGISTKARSTLRKSMNSAKSGGTMAYMPPERFGKDNTPIKASDVWAVGATLYELLAGDMPFGEHGGLMQKSGAEIPNIPGNWTKDLQKIIFSCLQKEPWDRPIASKLVEWTDRHFRGEKLVFTSSKKKKNPPSRKLVWGIAGGALALLLAITFFVFIMPTMKKDKPPQEQANEADVKVEMPEESAITDVGSTVVIDSAALEIPETPPQDTAAPPQTTAQTTSASPAPSAWLSEYDRILNLAQAAWNSKNYVKAKEEYTRALTLANRNGDRQKATFVTGQIAQCNDVIEAANQAAEEERQVAIKARLEAYNFVGVFRLGLSHMIVQRKADNSWGIIKQDGAEAEPFVYSQVSAKLKNDCYALKNDQGWVVFDTSMNKVATNIDNLDAYK